MYYAELNVPKNHVYLFKPQLLKVVLVVFKTQGLHVSNVV